MFAWIQGRWDMVGTGVAEWRGLFLAGLGWAYGGVGGAGMGPDTRDVSGQSAGWVGPVTQYPPLRITSGRPAILVPCLVGARGKRV